MRAVSDFEEEGEEEEEEEFIYKEEEEEDSTQNLTYARREEFITSRDNWRLLA